MSAKSLPNLETFAEAAERGSFTAAAHQLGITQAAVSQRIQQLETVIGTPLFRRHAGRVTLTDAGRRLHDYARRILDLTAEAVEAITGIRDEVGGELLVAASSVPGQHLLPPVLAAFHNQFPAVHVRVSVSDTEAVVRELEQGHAHLGFVGGQGGSSNLEYRRFASDELVLVIPRNHPWKRKKRVSVAEFLTLPLIQRERGSGSRSCLERSLERLRVAPTSLNVVLELGSCEAVKEAVFQRVGVAVLSRRAVENELKARRLKTVQIEGLPLDRDLFVVRNRMQVLPAPARLFLTLLTRES
ncbi:MAG: LysR family transcriptional regulator [Planctomycetia bacterium]|nr:LysR family transcriptional regulator [Planctomycetia bacterium]